MSLFNVITHSNTKYRGFFRQRERTWTRYATGAVIEAGSATRSVPAEPISAKLENDASDSLAERVRAASLEREAFGVRDGERDIYLPGLALNIVAAYETLMAFPSDDGPKAATF